MTHPTTLLRIDTSSRSTASVSRRVGDVLEQALSQRWPQAQWLRRDLASHPVEHLGLDTITGYFTPPDQLTPPLLAATATSDAVIAEVRRAEVLLITMPMYNFGLPSVLKAWIDQLVRIHQTVAFDGQQFTGLLTGKRAYVVVACGAGGYGPGGALAAGDFVQPYLRFVLGFLGITAVQFIPVEATNTDPAGLAATLAQMPATVAALLDNEA